MFRTLEVAKGKPPLVAGHVDCTDIITYSPKRLNSIKLTEQDPHLVEVWCKILRRKMIDARNTIGVSMTSSRGSLRNKLQAGGGKV